MLFSVLVANYNNSRFLGEAIESVIAQTYPHWEIILVDDGSTDEFEEVISRYQHLPTLRVLRNHRNEGCAYTKRRCLDHAQGELAAFLDPDDTLTRDALQVMVNAHAARPNCSLIHSTHFVCDENLAVVKISEKPRPLPIDSSYLMVSDGSVHAFASFKRACYERSAGLSPHRSYDAATDQELYYLLEETGSIHFIDSPLYYYRIHKGSISNMGQEARAMISHYMIIAESCQRRIQMLKKSGEADTGKWIQRYRTRYHKVKILQSFRNRAWGSFLAHTACFPFVGGMENIISYCKKIPKEGPTLFRRSFVETYKH